MSWIEVKDSTVTTVSFNFHNNKKAKIKKFNTFKSIFTNKKRKTMWKTIWWKFVWLNTFLGASLYCHESFFKKSENWILQSLCVWKARWHNKMKLGKKMLGSFWLKNFRWNLMERWFWYELFNWIFIKFTGSKIITNLI